MVSYIQKLIAKNEMLILALMLELLHFSLWVDFGSWVSRSLILIHLGMFLIWQPVWRSDEQLSLGNSLLFFLLTLLFIGFINWGLMFAWLILLCGFAGGTVIINQRTRMTYMVVLAFLTFELILVCTPGLFNIQLDQSILNFAQIAQPLLPVLILGLPSSKESTRLESVDLLHAMVTSMLMGLIIFGSLLYMFITGTEYLVSLIQALVGLAIFLFIISWMLSPRTGFSGLSQLWSKSLLNIGTPFEKWLSGLSETSLKQKTPDDFLEVAVEDLVSLNWIEGVCWKTRDSDGECGKVTKNLFDYSSDDIDITLYTNTPVGGALYLHCNLLVQLLEDFYIAKVRERTLAAQAHIQAVHEMGARVTHDIKNLLQSLKAITEVVTGEYGEADRRNSSKILERQLPHLTQRLQLSLDKLQAPENSDLTTSPLSEWWNDLTRRNESNEIKFDSNVSHDRSIPVELFDTVTENILENLREKARLDSNLCINVNILSDDQTISLTIADNGKAIPEEVAKSLLKGPINSENGLGIGLYQSAQLAEKLDYKFSLNANTDGKVEFSLNKV